MAEINTYYFEEGSTARDIIEVMPNREEIERRQRENAKRQRRAEERHKRYLMRKTKVFTIYLMMALMLFTGFLIESLTLQNDISTSMNNIASLENDISDLKASNKATEARINTNVNLYLIKLQALNNLGMVYASGDQIVYYDMDDSDYMSQYADIP